MCKQNQRCCTVVHNHNYNNQQGCGNEDEKCKSIKYGELQHFKGEKGTDPCEWEVGDVGQGFRNGVFGLYLLKEIQLDGTKIWETIRQSKDATL